MKCTPNPGQPGGGVFLMKYTLEFKLDCVNKYKQGIHIDSPVGICRHAFMAYVREWSRLFDDLGEDGLIHKSINKDWTPKKRFKIVSKVLAGNSIHSVSLSAHINSGQLYQWVKWYNEKGMDGLQCKKGQKPKVPIMKKNKKLKTSEQEELKLLRERNEYLEMENEYLKNSTPWYPRERPRNPRRKRKSNKRASK